LGREETESEAKSNSETGSKIHDLEEDTSQKTTSGTHDLEKDFLFGHKEVPLL